MTNYHKLSILVIMSDEITGMAVICEYTLRPVDICSFGRPRFLPALLSLYVIKR